jgi:hypothetical protein
MFNHHFNFLLRQTDTLQDIVDAVASARLKPHISQIIKLGGSVDVFKSVDKHLPGRVMIEIS